MSETQMVNLNVTDIADAVRIIDYAAEQGAYRGWHNIRQIMILRDKLDAFVTAASAVTEQAEEKPAENPVEAADTKPKRRTRKAA